MRNDDDLINMLLPRSAVKEAADRREPPGEATKEGGMAMESLKEIIREAFNVDLPLSGGGGSSFEDAIRIETEDSSGIGVEYEVLKHIHWLGDKTWQLERQRLVEKDGKAYDVLTVALDDEPDVVRNYYFDISRFYRKP